MTSVRIVDALWWERAVTLRLPFQFGSTEVRETAEAYVQVTLEIAGATHVGQAAQLMVPRWFNKRPKLSNAETIDELRATIGSALRHAMGRRGTALSLSRALRREVGAELPHTPALAAGFGPALVEMAVIDALCRAQGVAFWRAAQGDLFGLVDDAPPDLSPAALRHALSKIAPPARVQLRHTVGFDAPLHANDRPPDAPDDGLPVTLDEVIAQTGITAFKVKLKGDPEADLNRLRRIATGLRPVRDLSMTLDANEQYAPGPFSDFLDAFRAQPELEHLHAATRFIEQPFPREIALADRVSAHLPLVIDESDCGEDSFPQALAMGWSGTSIKSCKGVLRALLYMARAEQASALLSGEDLTCQPGLCWQQDTAMMVACGVRDVERNGHHFAGGLQGASDSERQRVSAQHPDIYAYDSGTIRLRIADGAVEIGSLDRPGFAGAGPEEVPLTATQP